MRVKGKYVCTVEIDIDFLYKKYMFPFEKIKENIVGGWLTDRIKDVITDEIMNSRFCKTTVTQQYADLYEVEDE